MKKKQTAVQQAIEYLNKKITINKQLKEDVISNTGKIIHEDRINECKSHIVYLQSLLPIEQQQIEEAFDAGENMLIPKSDYFTTTYKGE